MKERKDAGDDRIAEKGRSRAEQKLREVWRIE
jgi:hypothetical protein